MHEFVSVREPSLPVEVLAQVLHPQSARQSLLFSDAITPQQCAYQERLCGQQSGVDGHAVRGHERTVMLDALCKYGLRGESQCTRTKSTCDGAFTKFLHLAEFFCLSIFFLLFQPRHGRDLAQRRASPQLHRYKNEFHIC